MITLGAFYVPWGLPMVVFGCIVPFFSPLFIVYNLLQSVFLLFALQKQVPQKYEEIFIHNMCSMQIFLVTGTYSRCFWCVYYKNLGKINIYIVVRFNFIVIARHRSKGVKGRLSCEMWIVHGPPSNINNFIKNTNTPWTKIYTIWLNIAKRCSSKFCIYFVFLFWLSAQSCFRGRTHVIMFEYQYFPHISGQKGCF